MLVWSSLFFLLWPHIPLFLLLPQTNGAFNFRINSNFYREVVRYRFDPFCVNSRVRITAAVEEAGRGTKQSDTVSFSLVANPVRVKLADDNPQLFHAGLNYTLKVYSIESNNQREEL